MMKILIDWVNKYFVFKSVFILCTTLFIGVVLEVSLATSIDPVSIQHIGTSETYTYDEIKSSAYAEVGLTGGLSQVLLVKGIPQGNEVFVEVARMPLGG
ncbi:hypothetical protein [Pleomorphovibrio marinus]|uniref:hypothetical protein n=1 Tax=Pleomorphovibrio marinus TaxID=2164132 RepID=UPI0013004D29|nr:hypothetical protein [Pleomorphovibrio marinus]